MDVKWVTGKSLSHFYISPDAWLRFEAVKPSQQVAYRLRLRRHTLILQTGISAEGQERVPNHQVPFSGSCHCRDLGLRRIGGAFRFSTQYFLCALSMF